LISEGFSYSLSIAAQEAGQIFISNIASVTILLCVLY